VAYGVDLLAAMTSSSDSVASQVMLLPPRATNPQLINYKKTKYR